MNTMSLVDGLDNGSLDTDAFIQELEGHLATFECAEDNEFMFEAGNIVAPGPLRGDRKLTPKSLVGTKTAHESLFVGRKTALESRAVGNKTAHESLLVSKKTAQHSLLLRKKTAFESLAVGNTTANRLISEGNTTTHISLVLGNTTAHNPLVVGNKVALESLTVGNKTALESLTVGNKTAHKSKSEGNTITHISLVLGNATSRNPLVLGNQAAHESLSVSKKTALESLAVGNNTAHESLAVGNTNALESPAVGNNTAHESLAVGNTNALESLAVGNTNALESPAVGNNTAHESLAVGNTNALESPAVGNTTAHESLSVGKKTTVESRGSVYDEPPRKRFRLSSELLAGDPVDVPVVIMELESSDNTVLDQPAAANEAGVTDAAEALVAAQKQTECSTEAEPNIVLPSTWSKRASRKKPNFNPVLEYTAAEGRRLGSTVYTSTDQHCYLLRRRVVTTAGVQRLNLYCFYKERLVPRCLGTASVRDGKLRIMKAHNHPALIEANQVNSLVASLRNDVRNNPSTPYRQLLAQRLPPAAAADASLPAAYASLLSAAADASLPSAGASLLSAAADASLPAAAADASLPAAAADASLPAAAADASLPAEDVSLPAAAADPSLPAAAADPSLPAAAADASLPAEDVSLPAAAADPSLPAAAADPSLPAAAEDESSLPAADPSLQATTADASLRAAAEDASLPAVATDIYSPAADEQVDDPGGCHQLSVVFRQKLPRGIHVKSRRLRQASTELQGTTLSESQDLAGYRLGDELSRGCRNRYYSQDGHRYIGRRRVPQNDGGTRMYLCCDYRLRRELQCPGSAVTAGDNKLRPIIPHNHRPLDGCCEEPEVFPSAKTKRKPGDRVPSNRRSRTSREHTVSSRLPPAEDGDGATAEDRPAAVDTAAAGVNSSAAGLNWNSVRLMVRRERRRRLHPFGLPVDADAAARAVADALQLPGPHTSVLDKFAFSVVQPDNRVALAFCADGAVSSVDSPTRMYIDTSWRAVPVQFGRLLLISLEKCSVIVPVFFILVADGDDCDAQKTLYTAVFRQLAARVPSVTSLVLEWAEPVRRACLVVWPHAQLIANWHYYTQAVRRKVVSLRLLDACELPKLDVWLQNVLAVPLLPGQLIRDGWRLLIRQVPQVPEDRAALVAELVKYIRDYWMVLSDGELETFNQADGNTVNDVNSLLSPFSHALRSARHNLWQFMGKITQSVRVCEKRWTAAGAEQLRVQQARHWRPHERVVHQLRQQLQLAGGAHHGAGGQLVEECLRRIRPLIRDQMSALLSLSDADKAQDIDDVGFPVADDCMTAGDELTLTGDVCNVEIVRV